MTFASAPMRPTVEEPGKHMIATLVFYMFALICVASGVLVVTSRNPVHSVLFLILAFFNAGGLFVLAGAEFLAMLLIIVYVGAVAVLFMFVVVFVIVVVYVIVAGVVLLPFCCCCVSLFCFARCGVLSCVDFVVARWCVGCIGVLDFVVVFVTVVFYYNALR